MSRLERCKACGAKGRRECPALGGLICPVCCGTKRASEIACPPRCAYSPFSVDAYDAFLSLDESLNAKVMRRLAQHVTAERFMAKAARLWPVKDTESQEGDEIIGCELAIYTLLFVERDADGKTPAERWAAENWRGLSNDELVMLRARQAAYPTAAERPDEADARERPDVPPEVEQALVMQAYADHYRTLLDAPLSALDGLTPSAAAADPAMRPKLVELMKMHVNQVASTSAEKGVRVDITWVLEELGLDELL